jgi:hypothetical protein
LCRQCQPSSYCRRREKCEPSWSQWLQSTVFATLGYAIPSEGIPADRALSAPYCRPFLVWSCRNPHYAKKTLLS